MNCKDHQGNIVKQGDKVAFCRADVTYVGSVVKINNNLNPQIEYTFIDFRGKECTYKYTPIHKDRYIKL